MTTLYFITRLLTFFGASLRFFWEYIVCRRFHLPVEDIRCFKRTELCSHVEHELIDKKRAAFMICFVPLLLNFIFGLGFFLYSSYILIYAGIKTKLAAYLIFALGVALWSNMFPSYEDLLSFRDNIYSKETNLLIKIILAPFTAVIYAGSLLEKYSVSVLTSIAAGIAFPFAFEALLFAAAALKQNFF